MLQYQAPLEEFNFLAHKVLRLSELLPLLPEHHHIDADLFRATLEVGAELTQEQLLPLNGSGDAEVNAQSDAAASIYGSGNVEITGRPVMRRSQILGSGRITQVP